MKSWRVPDFLQMQNIARLKLNEYNICFLISWKSTSNKFFLRVDIGTRLFRRHSLKCERLTPFSLKSFIVSFLSFTFHDLHFIISSLPPSSGLCAQSFGESSPPPNSLFASTSLLYLYCILPPPAVLVYFPA